MCDENPEVVRNLLRQRRTTNVRSYIHYSDFLEKTLTTADEALFVDALKSHSRKAFNQLYERYTPTLLGILCRIVQNQDAAQDVLQDTFIKVWKNIHQHDPTKGRLFTWLLNVARNTALDHLKARKNADRVALLVSWDKVTFTRVEQIGFWDTVSTTLDAKHWQVIELIYFRGYSHAQVSVLLEMPLGTVKTRTRMALAELRNAFSNEYQLICTQEINR